ncbi:MAG: hypothetical protein ACREQB_06400 [Candidatus Binataceae bacterium]
MTFAIPTIEGIQRMNALLIAGTTVLLLALASFNAAIGCLVGGAVVMINFWVLAVLGRILLAAVGGHRGPGAKLGALAIPLKLLILAGLLYLLAMRFQIHAFGFGLGVLTQIAAIIIETGRVSMRPAS